MESIRIENLRSLEDTDTIEIKPLTVLIGENSSGKSTFLRTFPLLRQSVETSTTSPLLWYGRFVDFGSFNEAINNKSEKKEINFTFNFKISSSEIYSNYKNKLSYSFWIEHLNFENFSYHDNLQKNKEKDFLAVKISIINNKENNATLIKYVKFNINDSEVYIEFSPELRISSFRLDNIEYVDFFSDFKGVLNYGLIPQIYYAPLNEKNVEFNFRKKNRITSIFIKAIQIFLEKHLKLSLEENDFLKIIQTSNKCLNKIELLSQLKKSSSQHKKQWVKIIEKWEITSSDFLKYKSLILGLISEDLISIFNEKMSAISQNIYYIAPLRATAERYYRLQELSVEEVDYQGKNLSIFLRNLNIQNRENFSEWSNEFFGFSPEIITTGEHISITIKEKESNKILNLADKGFGFSQILPIIIQLWYLCSNNLFTNKNKTILLIIEQPELHLHPRLQAKLTDAFIYAIKSAKKHNIDFKIIIETHSETIINRIGHNIFKKKFNDNDINIVLFEKKNPDESTKVRISKFDSDGYLVDWPYGFFEIEED